MKNIIGSFWTNILKFFEIKIVCPKRESDNCHICDTKKDPGVISITYMCDHCGHKFTRFEESTDSPRFRCL